MILPAIAPIAPLSLEGTGSTQLASKAASGSDFMRVVGAGIERVNTDMKTSDGLVRALAAGENVPLHEVMIAMEKACIDLQFAVQVRDRLLEGYQQLMQMQL